MSKKIVVLGTGGTIAGMSSTVGDNVGYTAGQVGVSDLVSLVPALAAFPLDISQVAQIDSKDMSHRVWQVLLDACEKALNRDDVGGVVITHGTDTIEDTAWFLHSVLHSPKPVVLTCAMRPASALMADGPQNLLDAVAVAATPGMTGVVVVCAGRVHGAAEVHKVHPYRLDPFSSGDRGGLGDVVEGCFRQVRPPEAPLGSLALVNFLCATSPEAWPWVEIVLSHAGTQGRVVALLVDAGVSGLVVACTGNGTCHELLEDALMKADSAGVQIVRASRCDEGVVVPLPGEPRWPVLHVSASKARVSLMLRLATR